MSDLCGSISTASIFGQDMQTICIALKGHAPGLHDYRTFATDATVETITTTIDAAAGVAAGSFAATINSWWVAMKAFFTGDGS